MTRTPDVRVGLCATCRHASIITSSREMQFYLCRRSRTDPRFAKYPALPVLECPGYEKVDAVRTSGETKSGR